ncbi:MAG TPA: tetratricopeptide repeat protein [Enhygromyxa sp.]|nr:tetratricopeptide repeat protein [Enhygromyxa sp.]
MADFDPRQLDQLEDALEGLEEIDDLESLELSPALTERLAEYQDVLALCREAFPVEEPRVDLLTDVLAEARAVSRRPKLAEADGSGWRRFWTRWRGTMIPGLALAGTAAAVLLLLEPERDLDRSAQLTDGSQADDKAERKDSDSAPSEPTNIPQTDERDEPEIEQDVVEPVPLPTKVPDNSAGTPAVKKTKPRISKDTAPSVAPLPAPEPLSKDETWTTLERANADRRKGDCDRARSRYEQIIAASSDNLAISRAKAGIGLCLEQDRRNTEANQWFEQARGGNVGIDTWIEEQRNEQPLPGETKKAKSKKASADNSL